MFKKKTMRVDYKKSTESAYYALGTVLEERRKLITKT